MANPIPNSRSRSRGRLLFVAAIAGAAGFAQAAQSAPGSWQPGALGKLAPFYRATQLQGDILGAGLEPIPAYLEGNDIDLKYIKNPHLNEEVPFADTFNIARFLGGYRTDWIQKFGHLDPALGHASGDYVIKGANGSLIFRPDVVAQRLKPYLDAGYKLSDITLNIENTPWALARNGGQEGLFGQVEPPANWGQWQQTLEHFAADLKNLYGASAAPNFKMGNEYDTRKSFDGTADDYFQYYATGYRVLHAAFPSSQIAPGEFTGSGTCGNAENCIYGEKDLEDRANAAGLRPYYLPRSLNAFQGAPNASALRTVERAVVSYVPLGRVIPEIHQFGLSGQPFAAVTQEALKDDGTDQGPRSAAWQFITLMGLQQELRPRRVFHWRSFYSVARTPIQLLAGAGFANLVLDRYVGSDMTRLAMAPPANGSVAAAAIAFQSAQRKAVIVATSDVEAAPARVSLQVDLGAVFSASQLHALRAIDYAESDNAFLQIKNDLAAQNNLKPEFRACALCTGEPNRMAVDPQKGNQMIEGKYAAYVAEIKNSLRFRPASQLPTIKFDGTKLNLEMQGNEMLILEAPN